MADIITLKEGQAFTSSMAIADGVGNAHATVIRLVRNSIDDLEEFGRVGFEIAPFETAGGVQQREIALLNEQQATLLMTYMRNNDVVRNFKKRLVKAFYEITQQQRANLPSLPQDLPSALRLAADMAEQSAQQQAAIEEMIPKTRALDRLAASDGSIAITNAAKDLQVRPRDLFRWLNEHRWIYRRAGYGGWLAYQDRIQSGLLEHKVTTVERSDGSEKTVEQVRITSKGLVKLAELLANDEAA